MREILFRGKREDNSQWVIGFLSKTRGLDNKLHICIDYEEKGLMCSSIVIPETVGQYTGLTDKNGTKIFEGDIIKLGNMVSFVFFGISSFRHTRYGKHAVDLLFNYADNCEIIGNIHDNKLEEF